MAFGQGGIMRFQRNLRTGIALCGLSLAACAATVAGSYVVFTATLAGTIDDLPHPPRLEWIEAAAILAVTASIAVTLLGMLVAFALWTAGQAVCRTGEIALPEEPAGQPMP
jgi:hypothetical protein